MCAPMLRSEHDRSTQIPERENGARELLLAWEVVAVRVKKGGKCVFLSLPGSCPSLARRPSQKRERERERERERRAPAKWLRYGDDVVVEFSLGQSFSLSRPTGREPTSPSCLRLCSSARLALRSVCMCAYVYIGIRVCVRVRERQKTARRERVGIEWEREKQQQLASSSSPIDRP